MLFQRPFNETLIRLFRDEVPMVRDSLSLLALAAVVTFPGCKTITEDLPTKASTPGNPVLTVPVPIVVTPVVIPPPQSPAPAPAATPAAGQPESSPTPAPSGGGGTVGQSCAPAPAPGNERCPRESKSDFLGVVESAYDSLIAKNPSWFTRDGGVTYVKISENDWIWAVINEVRSKGYCAGRYAEEVSVRTSGAYSENFDVLMSTGSIRRGDGSYRSTCTPASTTDE
jgi:hypothetical protein